MKAGTAEKKAARAIGKYRKRGFLLAFLAPCTILFLIVYAYPLVTIFLTSFCKWNYENFTAPEFLGWSNLFDNYIKLKDGSKTVDDVVSELDAVIAAN